MGAKGHCEIWQSVFLLHRESLIISAAINILLMSNTLTKTLLCALTGTWEWKKDMETLDTIVQSHLNAWVDGFTAKRFTEITRAAMT